MNMSYIIVTPVRDEEAYLHHTLKSVVRQNIRPAQWVIVNDGSMDGTGEIIDEYAREHAWIRAVHRTNRGFRKSGGGVVEAFKEGLDALTYRDWDFIVKLDGDLSFEPDYFERCFAHFKQDHRLGVGGGMIYNVMPDGTKEREGGPAFHVRGASKIYRRKCWEDIGGFWPAPGWDTLDEVKANMRGWTSRSFPELPLTHYRVTGAADGRWRNLVKNGKSDFISGYHPLFMMAKCISRLTSRPYLFGSFALAYGFIKSYLTGIPQVDDPDLIRYLRRQQLGRILGGATIWK